MVVRISGEEQYRLDGDAESRLRELDDAAVAAFDLEDADGFQLALGKMLDYVRTNGRQLPADELEVSDLILPPADTTLAEVAEDFSGEGWIPD